MIILKMLVTSVPCALGSVASNSPSPCLDVASMFKWKKSAILLNCSSGSLNLAIPVCIGT